MEKNLFCQTRDDQLEEYKNLLLEKLKDTLEIAGFNVNDLRQEKLLLLS
jgi:hypothetical protein